MILLVDVGNSTLHLGLAQGTHIVWHRDVPSDARRFTAERLARLRRAKLDGAVISSVVPGFTPVFTRLAHEHLGVEPLILSYRTACGIRLHYRPRSALGPDRLANAVAALHLYRRDTIVVDLGTATTIETITREGDFLGGAILPGLGTMLLSLKASTGRLPAVAASPPARALGTSTAGAIRSGTFAAQFAGVDRVIEGICRETGRRFFLVATGGLARRFGRFIHNVSAVNSLLTLQGMAIAFQLNINPSRRTYG